MQRIAKFEKVSKEQFGKDTMNLGLQAAYEDIVLPQRATTGSAGYDFYAPMDIVLKPGEELTVPTGIRAKMQEGWVLMCCRSSTVTPLTATELLLLPLPATSLSSVCSVPPTALPVRTSC